MDYRVWANYFPTSYDETMPRLRELRSPIPQESDDFHCSSMIGVLGIVIVEYTVTHQISPLRTGFYLSVVSSECLNPGF